MLFCLTSRARGWCRASRAWMGTPRLPADGSHAIGAFRRIAGADQERRIKDCAGFGGRASGGHRRGARSRNSVRQQVSVSSIVRCTSTTGLTKSGAAKRERRGAYHHNRALGVVTRIRQWKRRTQRGTPGGHPPCTARCATRTDPVGACTDHPACLYACHGAMNVMNTRVPVWSTSCRRSVVLSMTRPDFQD